MDGIKWSVPLSVFGDPTPPEDQNDSIFGDIGTGLKQGVTTDLAHTVTGLVDLAGSAVGADMSATAAADKAGLADLEKSYYNELTPETKRALQAVDQAEGFWGTLGAYASNPRAIAYDVARALPLSLAGGGLGAAGAKGAAKVAGSSLAKNAAKKEILGSTGAKAANYWAAGGEGLVGAGMSASSIAQYNAENPETRDPLEGVGYAALTGLGTGLVAGAAGRIGGSVESAVFNKSIRETMANKPWASVGKSAVTEGLEEAAQAPTETVPQNWAEDKPWNEGLGQNIAQSMIAGSAMGGGAHGAMRTLRFASPGDGRPQVSQEPVDVNQAASGATMSMEGATPVQPPVETPVPLVDEEAASQQRRAEILAQRQAEVQAAEEAKAAKAAEKLAAKQARENERLAKAEQKRQAKLETAQRKADEKKAKEDEFQQARSRYLDIFGVPEDQRERYKKPVALDAVRKHYDKEGYAPAAKALREANEALGSRDFDNVNKLVPALNGISENATTPAEFADRFDGLAKQYAKSNPKKAEVYTLAAQAMRSPDKSMADVFDAHQRNQAFKRFEAANQAAPKNLPTYDLYDVQAGNLKPGKAQLKFTLRDQEITFQGQVKGKQFFPDTKQLNDYADYIEGKRERHPEFYDSIMQAINPADQASGAVAKGTDPEAEVSENALASGEPTAVSELVQSKADNTEEPDKQLEAAGIHVTSDIGGSKTTDERKDVNNIVGRLMYTRLLTKASNRGADGKRIVELDTKHKTFVDGSLAQLEEGVKNNPELAKEFQDAITSQEALDAVSRLEKWKPQRAANAALEMLVWLDKASRAANFDPKKADKLSEKLFNLVARGQAEEAKDVNAERFFRRIDRTMLPLIGEKHAKEVSSEGEVDIHTGLPLIPFQNTEPVFRINFDLIRNTKAETAVGKEIQKDCFFIADPYADGLAVPVQTILNKCQNPASDLKGLFSDEFIKYVVPAVKKMYAKGYPLNNDLVLVDGLKIATQRLLNGKPIEYFGNGGRVTQQAISKLVLRIPLDGRALPSPTWTRKGMQYLTTRYSTKNESDNWNVYVPYHELSHVNCRVVGRDKAHDVIKKRFKEMEVWADKMQNLSPAGIKKYINNTQIDTWDIGALQYAFLYPSIAAEDAKSDESLSTKEREAAGQTAYANEMYATLLGLYESDPVFNNLLLDPEFEGLANIVKEVVYVGSRVSNNEGSSRDSEKVPGGDQLQTERLRGYGRDAQSTEREGRSLEGGESGEDVGVRPTEGGGREAPTPTGSRSGQGEVDHVGSTIPNRGRSGQDNRGQLSRGGDRPGQQSAEPRDEEEGNRTDNRLAKEESGQALGAGLSPADGPGEGRAAGEGEDRQGEVNAILASNTSNIRRVQTNRSGQLSGPGNGTPDVQAEVRPSVAKGILQENGRVGEGQPRKAMGAESDDGRGQEASPASQGQGLTQRTQKAIDAAIDKVFKRKPSWKARAKNVNHFLFRTALGGYFTRDVIKMAYDATGIDGFRHWGNVHEKINTLRNELLKDASAISNKAANLPKDQRDVVNEYIKDAVVQGVWGYWHKGVFKDEAAYNEYRDGLEDQAKYDAEIAMRRRWVKLNKAQREVISDVFEYGNKQLRERYRLLKEKLDEQRMPALEEQDGEIPENAQLEELRKEVDRLSKSPYVPLMRAGSHMVIFKSADYVAAEKELKAQEAVFNSLEKPTKEDRKRVQKAASALNALKSSGDDYAVEFVDGYGTAEQIAKEYESEYPGSKVVFGERLEELKDNVPGYKQLERAANMLAKSMEEGELADKYGAHAKSLAKELHAMISKMYIESLAETSAKKRMLKKRTVRGFNQNMIENLMAAAPSTANMLAFMRYSDEVAKAGREIDESIKKLQGDDFAAARAFQSELIQRENLSTQQTSDTVNGILRTASMMMLLTNPAYYLQNMTQSMMMSAPFMAQRHGAQIFKRLVSNTMEVAKWMKDDPTLEKLEKQMLDDSIKSKPLTMDEWKALDHSRRHGHLDIGMTQDFGDVNRGGGKVRDTAVRVSDKLNKMARQVEMLNRVSTFLTAYRAEIMRGQSPAKAREYADDVIYQTHGDYSAFNAPKWFTYNGLTRVMTQFRKFQLIQAGLMTRLAANSFKGATPEVRAEARRQFAYMLATHMAFTGLKGTPFATVLLGIAAMGMGDSGDDGEDLIRKMIGDKDMSNLLMRGVPAWLGMDVSGKIGAENMLSPMPYMNAKFSDGRDGANELIAGALGPAASLVQKFYTAGQYFVQGDEWKALEYALPNGLATNLSKGIRFMTEGYSSKAGDVLVKPQDYDVGDFLIQTLGFQPRVMTDRMRVQDSLIRHKESFDAEKNRIYMDFKKARREGDRAGMSQARREMLKLAAEARKQGLTGYTIQNMVNAANEQRRRERQAVGGVASNKNDRQFVKKMSEI